MLLGLTAVLALSAPAGQGLARAQAQSQAQNQPQAQAAGNEAGARVVRVTAEKFEFKPERIELAKGKPVVLELISLDRLHGFRCPGLGIRVDVAPDKVTRVPLTPDKAGSFPFVCDVFCGEGHDEMTGVILVTE
ncbi:MAG: cupredoxin domain-containing protein [Acidobacteriota bacterium]